jgi:hypothetical protein
MTVALPTPILTADYSFPQVAPAQSSSVGGIASISHNGSTFRFRTNPNEFHWDYTLNKRIDPTYGGRVIQLLGTKIENFSLKADAGGGRWDYLNRMALFLRDVMVNQRDGTPAVFEYTTRGWKLNCYVVSIPFADAVEEVLHEFEIVLKVQEDVNQVMTQASLGIELSKLTDGVAFRRSQYNDPTLQGQAAPSATGAGATTPGNPLIQGIQTISQFLPNGVGGGLGGILGGL